MKLFGMMADITARYAFGEAWIYDHLIAPSVIEMVDRVDLSGWRDLPQGAKLLDVGCGGGHLADVLARRRPDLRITGLDLDLRQARRARRRAKGCSVLRGSALALPFTEGALDVVVSVGSLKHWPDRRGGLGECVRVLRSGGALVVVEVDRACRLEESRAFVAQWKFPRPARAVNLAIFRTWIAGQSLDLEEARALGEPLGLAELTIKRIPGTPGFLLAGRKH